MLSILKREALSWTSTPTILKKSSATNHRMISKMATKLYLSICTSAHTRRKIKRVKSLMLWQMHRLPLPIGHLKKWVVNYQKSALLTKITGPAMVKLRICFLSFSVLISLWKMGVVYPFFKNSNNKKSGKNVCTVLENKSVPQSDTWTVR